MERTGAPYHNGYSDFNDAVFMRLASQLQNLRDEFRDQDDFRSGLSTPVEDFSYFSSPNSSSSNEIGLFGSIGQWPMTGYYRKYSFNDEQRFTDTPKTWPTSTDTTTESHWGPSPGFSTDSGISTALFGGQFRGEFRNQPVVKKPKEKQSLTKYDLEEWTRALKPPVPGPGYICRICGNGDHYVQNCPRAPSRDDLKTPYQGYNQCFGMFECTKCQRHWGSHDSYAEMGQICRYCQCLVFPYKQYPLDKIPESKLHLLKKQHGRRRK